MCVAWPTASGVCKGVLVLIDATACSTTSRQPPNRHRPVSLRLPPASFLILRVARDSHVIGSTCSIMGLVTSALRSDLEAPC